MLQRHRQPLLSTSITTASQSQSPRWVSGEQLRLDQAKPELFKFIPGSQPRPPGVETRAGFRHSFCRAGGSGGCGRSSLQTPWAWISHLPAFSSLLLSDISGDLSQKTNCSQFCGPPASSKESMEEGPTWVSGGEFYTVPGINARGVISTYLKSFMSLGVRGGPEPDVSQSANRGQDSQGDSRS